MTSGLTPFSALLAGRERAGSTVAFTVTPDWLQGRTSFGGLIAALAVQAMHDVAGGDELLPPLRALQTNFVGPVGEGRMEVAVQLLRAGRNTRQLQATVSQAGADGRSQTAAVLLATFGSARPSALPSLRPERPVAACSAEAARPLPRIDGVTPAFLRHFDIRWAAGAPPYSGGSGWTTQLYVRLEDAAEVHPDLLTVLLADTPPTPAIGALKARAPSSSVTWALELRPLSAPPGDGLWRIDLQAVAVADGYVNQQGQVWAPDGQLAALAYQVVAVYA